MPDLSKCRHRLNLLTIDQGIPVHGCAAHGRCTMQYRVDGLPTCKRCKQFDDGGKQRVQFGQQQREGVQLKKCAGCKGNVRLKVPAQPAPTITLPDLSNPKSKWASRPTKPFGVITGANSTFWPTLHALAYACHAEQVPLAVADHGLTGWQMNRLRELGAVILDCAPDPEYLEAARVNSHPGTIAPAEAWHKPLVCLEATAEKNIWIDSDAVPVRGLRELFDLFQNGPWLTRAHGWGGVHLYRDLLQAIGGRDLNGSDYSFINSGVFGFHHGDKWIQQWADLCLFLPTVQELAKTKAILLRDQSALVSLLAHSDDPPRILPGKRFNFPANGLPIGQQGRKKYDTSDPAKFLDAVRTDHPEASIVHWLGKEKPQTEPGYWEKRKDFKYYRTVVNIVRGLEPKTLLDVGGARLRGGCRYLDWIPGCGKTSVEQPPNPTVPRSSTVDGVAVVEADFLSWESGLYDVVLCLQCLEHVKDPARFAQKLFDCARRAVVISVPYKWPEGGSPHHLHDEVDEAKLYSWTGREPDHQEIVQEDHGGKHSRRLVCLYRLGEEQWP